MIDEIKARTANTGFASGKVKCVIEAGRYSSFVLSIASVNRKLCATEYMGLKETANFLISLGARTDIFVLTMLGKTAYYKGFT